jgi:hypothetical protein
MNQPDFLSDEAKALGVPEQPLPPPPADEQPLPPPPADEQPLPPPPPEEEAAPPIPALSGAPATFAPTDTETGGLDPRCHPLLSISVLVADATMQHVDGMYLKIKPPQDTWLEVPIRDQMFLTGDDAPRVLKADFYLNVYTGEVKSASEYVGQANRYEITAYAAQTNFFVRPGPDGKWDLQSYKAWIEAGVTVDEADRLLAKFLEAASPYKLTGVAHNATFDEKFVTAWLPLLRQRYAKPSDVVLQALGFAPGGKGGLATYTRVGWICTVELMKAWRKKVGHTAGNNKLEYLAELAGVKNDKAHDAYADTKTCLAGLRFLATTKSGGAH